MKSSTKDRIDFIKQNLHQSNVWLSNMLGISRSGVQNFLSRYKIARTKEQICLINKNTTRPIRSQVGELNANWKGGISKNHYAYKKRQVERYPERVAARNKVHLAIKHGKLIKMPCTICGETKSFAHHEDYSKPLEVIFYCRKHHREKHDNKH